MSTPRHHLVLAAVSAAPRAGGAGAATAGVLSTAAAAAAGIVGYSLWLLLDSRVRRVRVDLDPEAVQRVFVAITGQHGWTATPGDDGLSAVRDFGAGRGRARLDLAVSRPDPSGPAIVRLTPARLDVPNIARLLVAVHATRVAMTAVARALRHSDRTGST